MGPRGRVPACRCTVWRDLMALHYPGAGWMRLRHDMRRRARALPRRTACCGSEAVDRRCSPSEVAGGTHDAGERPRRAIADAVLYEGYLLYPYRATSAKNQARWQFGVLGPPGAASAGVGDGRHRWSTRVPGRAGRRCQPVHVHCASCSSSTARSHATPPAEFDRRRADARRRPWVTWDEAVERERRRPVRSRRLDAPRPVPVDGRRAAWRIEDGRPAAGWSARAGRCAAALVASPSATARSPASACGPQHRRRGPRGPDAAIAASLIGTHLLADAPAARSCRCSTRPDAAAAAATGCASTAAARCSPGEAGERDLLLVSPIILYDHPEIAERARARCSTPPRSTRSSPCG